MPDAGWQQDIKGFKGSFLVWKISSSCYARKITRMKLPWLSFATLEDAIEVAAYVDRQLPDSTFVVIKKTGAGEDGRRRRRRGRRVIRTRSAIDEQAHYDALTPAEKTGFLPAVSGGTPVERKTCAKLAASILLPERPVQRALVGRFTALRCYAVHTPNGSHLAGDAKARAMQMARLKKDGVSLGFPDLTIIDQLAPRVGFVEVKREGRTELTTDQVKWRDEVPRLDIPALVNDPAGAPAVLKLWGWR